MGSKLCVKMRFWNSLAVSTIYVLFVVCVIYQISWYDHGATPCMTKEVLQRCNTSLVWQRYDQGVIILLKIPCMCNKMGNCRHYGCLGEVTYESKNMATCQVCSHLIAQKVCFMFQPLTTVHAQDVSGWVYLGNSAECCYKYQGGEKLLVNM